MDRSCTGPSSSYPEHTHKSCRSEPSSDTRGSPSYSRLACLRRCFSPKGISDRVIEVICKSWPSSTEAAYSSPWRMWGSLCFRRGTDPLSTPLNNILEFLLEQFQAGKPYRTINSLCSAISMTHLEVNGIQVGQHRLVTCFRKGVFNCRLPAPKPAAVGCDMMVCS